MLEFAAGEVDENCLVSEARRSPVGVEIAERDEESRTPLFWFLVAMP